MPTSNRLAAAGLLLAASQAAVTSALAQAPPEAVPLPDIVVEGRGPVPASSEAAAAASVEAARVRAARIPGGVAVVPSSAYRDTAAKTIKDVLDYVPGVFVQPKWGEDTRLSIRGSGLSRNFHLRGVRILVDGIPINTADGSGDFTEIDPLAALYAEVYKGANALRFGVSTLGGAILFTAPTGRDVPALFGRAEGGSYGYRRFMVGSGGVAGAADYFIAGSWLVQDGFRRHSEQDSRRLTANLGYQITPNIETRFYLNLNDLRNDIPGSVTRFQAINFPRRPAFINAFNDNERNVYSGRVANKTTFTFGNTVATIGGYYLDKQLDHPIFQYLRYNYNDGGMFANVVNVHDLGGNRAEAVAGINVGGGFTRVEQFVNLRGGRGNPTVFGSQRAFNVEPYGEYRYFVRPDLALIAGAQASFASRAQSLRFGGVSGAKDFAAFNPRFGALWQIDPGWQAFANLSRSFEPPPLSEVAPAFAAVPRDIRAQSAWTVEIGTRGRREDVTWEVALYRANLTNELQFFDLGNGASQVLNADRTVHQGVEAAAGVNLLRFAPSVPVAGKLWLNAAYTYNDFRFVGDPLYGNNILPGAPAHFLRAELVYKDPSGFYAGPNVEWVPRAFFADNANTLRTTAYATLGVKAGYDFRNGVSLFLDARNLTDRRYIASTSVTGTATAASALFEPGFGRTIYGGVRYRW